MYDEYMVNQSLDDRVSCETVDSFKKMLLLGKMRGTMLLTSEEYLGVCQTSMTELLLKIVNPFMHNVVKWPNIL